MGDERPATPATRVLRWLWGDPSLRRPWLTWLFAALLVTAWVASELLPGERTVRLWLGHSAPSVAEGEWWRLVTPLLLNTAGGGAHPYSALEHLAGNLLPLVLAGPRVEHLLGRVRYALVWPVAEVLGRGWVYVHFPGSGYEFDRGGGTSIVMWALRAIVLLDALAHRRERRGFLAAVVAVLAVEVVLGALQVEPLDNAAHAAGAVAGATLWFGFTLRRRFAAVAAVAAVLATGFGLAGWRTFETRRVSDGVGARVHVGPIPLYAAAAGRDLWVTTLLDATVSRVDVDAARLTRRIGTGRGISNALGVGVAGDGHVWAVVGPRSVVRIDPATNRIVGRVAVPEEASGLVFAAGSVWVTSLDADVVSRIDPATEQVVATVPVGDAPYRVAGDDRAVWVANYEGRNVTRIDPATNEVVAAVWMGAAVYDVAVSADRVWVALADGIAEVDPATDRRVRRRTGESRPFEIAYDERAGLLWVTQTNNVVHVVDTVTLDVVRRVRLGVATAGDVVFVGDDAWVTDLRGGDVVRVAR